jgi:uncharacterized protein YdeI (YjbR/CyaY-like superfamily)
MKPVHFATPADFRRWLEKHHATETELQIGFYKKSAGKPGMVYKEAVDEALCFGWIDGLVRSIDAERYQQRFTPRKPGSIWSNINVGHVTRLIASGSMQPAGLAAFNARSAAKTGIYSFEQAPKTLPPALAKKFRAHAKAWAFFNAQPPGYRHRMIHKIVSPKQAATREGWLERVIAASAAGKRVQ